MLDMGEPVRIVDLARQMIRLSGLAEDDIRIEYTGLRPGEKLYEEPLADAEKTLPTPHPKLRVAQARLPENGALLEEVLAWLETPGIRAGPRSGRGCAAGCPNTRPPSTETEITPLQIRTARRP